MAAASENCNSRHFSWFMKSCFPNTNDSASTVPINSKSYFNNLNSSAADADAAISSLPDDLLLECLSRVPTTSLSSISLVCRNWSRLLLSPTFFSLRRLHGHLSDTIFAVSATNYGLFAANFSSREDAFWKIALFRAKENIYMANFHGLLSHARLSAIGPRIFIIGRNAVFLYDTWSGIVTERSAMNFSRKKFANAVVSGKIYVAGGSPTTTAVEEYDPETDTWKIVTHSARRRYGCIGASVDGIFYVIGGLKIGNNGSGVSGNQISRGGGGSEAAHVYASSMDMYDVEARVWLRSRSVPGGGCVVAACSAIGFIFVLASHAVELSFWKFDARRDSNGGKGVGFGEWFRLKSPPLPTQVRLDSTVRFSFVGKGETVVLIQVSGCIDDLLRRSGRNTRGLKEGLVLIYDTRNEEWSRGVDLPEVIQRAACVCVEC